MKNQLIPPPELAPPSIRTLSGKEKVALWGQMVDEGDQIVLAGFRSRSQSDEEAKAKFIQWLERRNMEHDRAVERMIKELRRRERENAN
jgi:hypothetical protein